MLKAGSDIGENAQKLGLIVYGEHGVAFTKVRVKRNMLELVQRRIDSNNHEPLLWCNVKLRTEQALLHQRLEAPVDCYRIISSSTYEGCANSFAC